LEINALISANEQASKFSQQVSAAKSTTQNTLHWLNSPVYLVLMIVLYCIEKPSEEATWEVHDSLLVESKNLQ
jgi:hypothetical protein